MSVIGKPLLVPAGGGISKYFLVNDTLSNGGIIRDIELVDGQPNIQSSKSAVITTAGTTYITPDSGYDALERVDVTVSDVEPLINSILDRTISGSFEDSTITEIGDYTFYYCSSLTSVSFPNCTTIGSYAFQSCTSLITISFPNCEVVNFGAFQYCHSLTNIYFPKCVSILNQPFYRTAVENVDLPLCSTIGSAAFQQCSYLSIVNIPKCEIIYSQAFQGCSRLLSLYLTSNLICTLSSSNAFSSTPIAGYTNYTNGQYGSIYVPSSLLSNYKTAINWSYFSSRFIGI